MNILFPHDKIRKIQDDFVNDLVTALKSKKHILAHAPTDLVKVQQFYLQQYLSQLKIT